MSCRLKSYELPVPGGYPYENTEGIYRKFPSEPLIEAQAQNVSAFRKGNSLPRSSLAECLQDVDGYTARRLGCHQSFCFNDETSSTTNVSVALNQSSPILNTGCGGCGAKIQ